MQETCKVKGRGKEREKKYLTSNPEHSFPMTLFNQQQKNAVWFCRILNE